MRIRCLEHRAESIPKLSWMIHTHWSYRVGPFMHPQIPKKADFRVVKTFWPLSRDLGLQLGSRLFVFDPWSADIQDWMRNCVHKRSFLCRLIGCLWRKYALESVLDRAFRPWNSHSNGSACIWMARLPYNDAWIRFLSWVYAYGIACILSYRMPKIVNFSQNWPYLEHPWSKSSMDDWNAMKIESLH